MIQFEMTNQEQAFLFARLLWTENTQGEDAMPAHKSDFQTRVLFLFG
jgi:hypothetical protein